MIEQCPKCLRSKSYTVYYNDTNIVHKCWRAKCGYLRVDQVAAWAKQDEALAKQAREKLARRAGDWARITAQINYKTPKDDIHAVLTNYGVHPDIDVSNVYTLEDSPKTLVFQDLTSEELGGKVIQTRHYPTKTIRTYKRPTAEGNVWSAITGEEAYFKKLLVIVEDPVSMRAVAATGINSVCLYGTNLDSETLTKILKYVSKPELGFREIPYKEQHALIWLDKDALDKAARMTRDFSTWGFKTSMISTNRDPKTYSTQEIKTILGEYCKWN